MSKKITYCGFVKIIGRSNVGKSTLFNKLLGQKISITSCKSQTTRHNIIGIHTNDKYQTIYIDTPGIYKEHLLTHFFKKKAMGSYNVNLFIFVVEGIIWTKDEEMILNNLRNNIKPVILVINKVDNITEKSNLLPYIRSLSNRLQFLAIIPISAKTGMNIDIIRLIVHKQLPEAIHFFPEKNITDRSSCFIASEIIREKLMRFLGAELPYSVSVKIGRFQKKESGNYIINSLIFVERKGQKRIVIGKGGIKIKKIGIEARKDMQKIFKALVYLTLWVKVKSSNINEDYIKIF